MRYVLMTAIFFLVLFSPVPIKKAYTWYKERQQLDVELNTCKRAYDTAYFNFKMCVNMMNGGNSE